MSFDSTIPIVFHYSVPWRRKKKNEQENIVPDLSEVGRDATAKPYGIWDVIWSNIWTHHELISMAEGASYRPLHRQRVNVDKTWKE